MSDDSYGLVAGARSPEDVQRIVRDLVSRLYSGEFVWQNCDLRSFLEGIDIALESYVDPSGGFAEEIARGPWAIMEGVIRAALVVD